MQGINLQPHIILNNTNSFSSDSFLCLPSLLNLCYLKHLFINVSKLISTKYYSELFTVRWFPFFKLSLRGFELQLTRKPRSCKQIITLIMLLIECLSRFFSPLDNQLKMPSSFYSFQDSPIPRNSIYS